MKSVFNFRHGCHLSGDAQAVGERLEAIKAKSSNLTPDMVVDDARAPRSPLHLFFEWDNTVAAEKYRMDQAGHLIRSVQVTFEDVEPQQERQVRLSAVAAAPATHPAAVRAFVSITRSDGARSYESTATAMNDPEMRRQVLARAHMEMASVGRKYRELNELADVFGALDRVGELIGAERQPA